MLLQDKTLEHLLDEAVYHQQRDISKSKRLAEEALARSEELGSRAGQALALRLLAVADFNQGRAEEGIARLEWALTLARCLGEAVPLSACLNTRGWFHYVHGELLESIPVYREAIALRMRPGEEIARANTCNLLGVTLRELGDVEQALIVFAQARELHHAQNNPAGEGHCLNNLGTLEADRKCYQEAIRYYHEALACSRVADDLHQETICLSNITQNQLALGQPQKAVAFARETRRCARLLKNPELLVTAWMLDGMVSCARGRFPRAERSLLFALDQSRQYAATQLELRILNELGNLYLKWQRPQEAQRFLEAGLTLGETAQANLQLTACHEYLVKVMEQQQNFERALFHHREFYRLECQRFDRAADRQRLALRMSLDLERAEREAAAHQERNIELTELARRDSMTGLYNHRAFQEILSEYMASGQPLALLLLDVDHFKSYNDTFGHPAGDTVLLQLARLLQDSVRKTDIAARYGGEEFAVILLGESAEDAQESAARLSALVRCTAFPHRTITLSIGVAISRSGISPSHLIAAADSALYQAKHQGRDCWVCATP